MTGSSDVPEIIETSDGLFVVAGLPDKWASRGQAIEARALQMIRQNWGVVSPGLHLFTPRLSDGRRARMEIDSRDYQIVKALSRHPAARYEVTDRQTGKRWIVQVAECSLPGCYCDAEIVGGHEA